MSIDHSGVAGERSDSQIVLEPEPTRVPVPDPETPSAAILAGARAVSVETVDPPQREESDHGRGLITITDEMVDAYRAAFGRSFREDNRTDRDDVRASLAAAAPLIAAQALRQAAHELMIRRRGLDAESAERGGLHTAEVALKHRANRLELAVSGPAFQRADELERGTDR